MFVCLAAGSAAWTLLDGLHPAGVPHGQLRHGPLPFAHLAALASVACSSARRPRALSPNCSAWPTCDWRSAGSTGSPWGAAAAAVALCLGTGRPSSCRPDCTSWDLSAAGMAMCAAHLDPLVACWRAALALPAFALSAAALGRLLPRVKPVGRLLRIPDVPTYWPVDG